MASVECNAHSRGEFVSVADALQACADAAVVSTWVGVAFGFVCGVAVALVVTAVMRVRAEVVQC